MRDDARLLAFLLLLAATYVCTWVAGVDHGYAQGLDGAVRTWALVSGSVR